MGTRSPGFPAFIAPLLALATAGSPPSPAHAESWAAEDSLCRRRFTLLTSPGEPGELARVHFLSLGFMKPDASDLRAFGPQGPLPLTVLWKGLDSCTLAVELQPGIREFSIYYGNPNPGTSPPPAQIRRGLRLETRPYLGGSFQTWKQMASLVAQSGEPFGCDFVPQVFHGFNPFGPSDRYVSIYEGHLRPPVSGNYIFATTSDDASYLLIDGKLAAQQVQGRAPGDARHAGQPVPLDARKTHHFLYLHVEVEGDQAAVAAWKPPNAEFSVIPPSAFPGLHSTQLKDYSVRHWPVSPDLAFSQEGDLLFRENTCFRYAFRDTTPGDALAWEPFWDFGDGNISRDRTPVHIYLERGNFTVTFALRKEGHEYRVAQRIRVDHDWSKQAEASTDTLEQYYPHLKGYNFKAMSTTALERAFAIFTELRKPPDLLEVAHALVLRDEILNQPDKLFLYGAEYGRQLSRVNRDYPKAIETFLFIADHIQNPTQLAELRMGIADVRLFFEEKYEQALRDYETILRDCPDPDSKLAHQARIRIGETNMHLGQPDKALAAFQAAESHPSFRRPYDQKQIFLGGAPQRIEDAIRRKEFDDAAEELNRWEWEYPTERIKGHSTLWRIRLAQAQRQHEEAIKQATLILHANPQSPYAVELILHAAQSHEAMKNYDSARKLLERIVQDYPESPLQREANDRLQKMR